MKNETLNLKAAQTPKRPATKKSVTQTPEAAGPWQANFKKRLPHRVGEPLSSSGGGDGGINS